MNYTTLPFYWGHYEREEGKPDSAYASKAAQWCRKNGIIPKGHPLTWHDSPVAWLRDKSPDQALDLQLGRIEREVGAFAGLIDKWDVANESILWPRWDELAPPEIAAKDHIHKIVKKTGRTELLKKCFAAARNANPQAALVLNDGGYHSFYQVIQACLAQGVDLDVIGIETHMHGGYFGGEKLWAICKLFESLAMPIHFTETTILSGEPLVITKFEDFWQEKDQWASTREDEDLQAEQVMDFYRVLFSHPSVEAITWWNLTDQGSWMHAPAGLLRDDLSPKPSYQALKSLIRDEWWTGRSAFVTDENGRSSFRGFLGQYQLTCRDGAAGFSVSEKGQCQVKMTMP